MRFDPVYFIDLCKRSGVELRREGPFLCYDTHRTWHSHEAALVAALRQHKDELMGLLADTSPQLDLFDPYN